MQAPVIQPTKDQPSSKSLCSDFKVFKGLLMAQKYTLSIEKSVTLLQLIFNWKIIYLKSIQSVVYSYIHPRIYVIWKKISYQNTRG